jgi:hypothetical protein
MCASGRESRNQIESFEVPNPNLLITPHLTGWSKQHPNLPVSVGWGHGGEVWLLKFLWRHQSCVPHGYGLRSQFFPPGSSTYYLSCLTQELPAGPGPEVPGRKPSAFMTQPRKSCSIVSGTFCALEVSHQLKRPKEAKNLWAYLKTSAGGSRL